MKKQAILIVLASVALTSLIWLLVLDYYKIDLASLGNRQNTISNTTSVEENVEKEYIIERPTKQSAKQSTQKKSTSIKEETNQNETVATSKEENLSPIGYWIPVETSEYIVEISKYNALKIRSKQVSDVVFENYTYKISGNKITYGSEYEREGSFNYKVSKNGNNVYLEIYDNPKYAGKYRKK